MTQWPDEPPGGGTAGPPPERYGPPPAQYAPPSGTGYPMQYQQPGASYGAPGGPYGATGSPYGLKPPRETGALVVCIVLLVLALIGSFIASAAVYGNLTDDSSSSPPPAAGTYGGGGSSVGVGGSSSVGGSSASGSSGPAPTSADNLGAIRRNFPVYPGARRVSSAKKYLQPGGLYNRAALNYVSNAKAGSLYHWYRTHLSADHLMLNAASVDRDGLHSHRVTSVFSSIRSSDETVYGEFYIEAGVHGQTVVVVTLNG